MWKAQAFPQFLSQKLSRQETPNIRKQCGGKRILHCHCDDDSCDGDTCDDDDDDDDDDDGVFFTEI